MSKEFMPHQVYVEITCKECGSVRTRLLSEYDGLHRHCTKCYRANNICEITKVKVLSFIDILSGKRVRLSIDGMNRGPLTEGNVRASVKKDTGKTRRPKKAPPAPKSKLIICVCGNIATEDTEWGKICRSCLHCIKHKVWDVATIVIVYGVGSPEELAYMKKHGLKY